MKRRNFLKLIGCLPFAGLVKADSPQIKPGYSIYSKLGNTWISLMPHPECTVSLQFKIDGEWITLIRLDPQECDSARYHVVESWILDGATHVRVLYDDREVNRKLIMAGADGPGGAALERH